MSITIQEECVSCALCVAPCPEDCIVEEADQFVINQEKCTSCNACIEVCPMACIVPSPHFA